MTGSSHHNDGEDGCGGNGGTKDICGGDAVCEGCCELIFSRFVMKVGNTSWHEECLFCSECHISLNNSCFYKDGRLFCRTDYERRYGVKCGRCGQCLWPNEMVMRTRHYIYHLFCFICTVCGRSLSTGDQYVIRAGQVVCMDDYEKEYFMVQGFAAAAGSGPGGPGSMLPGSASSEFVSDGQQGITDDFVVETSGRHQRDGRRGPKRPRTILTAAQRRQFKASFEVSPKPCRKVREALAKETGLSVRVVQVWFQNQRAKMKKMQRRGKVDKDGKKTKDGEKSKSSDGKESFEGGDSSVHSRDDFIDSADDDDDDDDDMSTYGGHLEVLDSSDRAPSSVLEAAKCLVGPPLQNGPLGLSSSLLGHHPPLTHQPLNSDSLHLTSNPIDKLYLMQDSYFTHM